MASLNGYVDPDAGTPGTFETFAAGPQMLELIESDIAATNDGKGMLFKYRINVTEGDQEGRLIFGNIMLQHKESGSNPKMATAVKMGQEAFKAIREVTGVPDPEDTQDLHFKGFVGYVKITPAKGQYEAKNEVDWGKTYKYLTDGITTVEDASAWPKAANDNAKPANDNVQSTAVGGRVPAAKPAPKGTPAKGAWPRKAA